jgi:transmembrane sensor
VLNALEASLPVKVRRILPWWVTVDAAEAAGAARKPG